MMTVLMKLFLKDRFLRFSQEKSVRMASQISAGLLTSSLILLLLKWRDLPSEVPLFYSLPWGEEQIGQSSFLFFLPLSSLILGVINFPLALFSFDRHPLASKILVWITTSLTLLTTITLVKIIFLVT